MKTIIYVICTIILTCSACYAMERFDIVTTEELRQMLDDRDASKIDFLLVNSLDEIICQNAFIPGSINIPWGRVMDWSARLGNDKDKLIIMY